VPVFVGQSAGDCYRLGRRIRLGPQRQHAAITLMAPDPSENHQPRSDGYVSIAVVKYEVRGVDSDLIADIQMRPQ
jgi:hypothetical protein